MPPSRIRSPFSVPQPERLHLARPPLASVLAQIKFPRPTASQTGAWTERLAGALACDYPEMNDFQEMAITVTSEGQVQSAGAGNGQQFHTADREWHVSIGSSLVTLQATKYPGSDEFMLRLETVLAAFQQVARPTRVERVGFRYTNCVELEGSIPLEQWVRKEYLGALLGPYSQDDPRLVHSLSQTVFDFGSAQPVPGPAQVLDGLQVQWGQLPPGAVLDHSIPPLAVATWVLDLDAFVHLPQAPFELGDILDHANGMARRAYGYFRWVVTEAFLDWFGAVR